MTKRKKIQDINEQLENMEIISNRDTFRVLSMLAKHGSLSFSELKNELNLNPNSLHRCLSKLSAHGLIENYYEKKEDKKMYSFYKISSKGHEDLHLNIGVPRVWEILKKFKDVCRLRGWRTSESEDWIEADDKYNTFLWVKDIHPSSFRRIISNRKCVIMEGSSYHIVEPTYTAWLFLERPSDDIVMTICENSEFSNSIVIYDLSQSYLVKPNIKRLNQTDSKVFREFDNFLESQCKIKLIDYSNTNEQEQSCLLKAVHTRLNHDE